MIIHCTNKKNEQEAGISAIPFTNIPDKSLDASCMEFSATGLLKSASLKASTYNLSYLRKAVQEEMG